MKHASHHINLINWINKRVPEFVCRLPEVTYISHDGSPHTLEMPVVAANIQAVSECWELARYYGVASVKYYDCRGVIEVKPYTNSHRNREFDYCDKLTMYGNKVPSKMYGFPIVTSELEDLICKYKEVVKHASQKVAHSYGELISLGGTNTDDVPLLEKIQDKTLEDWETYRQILAAEGSALSNVTSSISDLERVLRPFQEAISAESGVPYWLLFPNKTSSQFEMEERDVWATGLFTSTVMPVLLGLLSQQGYTILDVKTPNYRDNSYAASVKNSIVDSAYKESATARNLSSVKIAEQKWVWEQSNPKPTSESGSDVGNRKGRVL